MDEVKGGLFSPEGELPATVRRVAGVAPWPAVVGMEDPNGVREHRLRIERGGDVPHAVVELVVGFASAHTV